MEKLKAIIIEDEASNRINLANLLREFCPDVDLIGEAANVLEGVKLINQLKPKLVFLDIEMPVHNGFKLFDYFTRPPFHVIFTTAHDEYALKALKISAIDYLLKPIDLEELMLSIEKAKSALLSKNDQSKYTVLQTNINSKNGIEKISIPTKDGYLFIDVMDIIYCKSDSNYTNFVLKNGKTILVSQTLKIYDDLLSGNNFFRISRSCLVNLKYMERYLRQKKSLIVMSNGDSLILSPKKREKFMEAIKSLSTKKEGDSYFGMV